MYEHTNQCKEVRTCHAIVRQRRVSIPVLSCVIIDNDPQNVWVCGGCGDGSVRVWRIVEAGCLVLQVLALLGANLRFDIQFLWSSFLLLLLFL